jgi:hypothetical protein
MSPEATVDVITTIATAAGLLVAAAVGVTSRRATQLMIIATMISLIPEARRPLSWLRFVETGRSCNEGRRTGTIQPRAGSATVDR